MENNRRGFLKKAGCAAVGLGCGLPLLGGCSKDDSADGGEAQQWAMVINLPVCKKNPEIAKRAIGACDHDHKVPHIEDANRDVQWIWEENHQNVFPDQVHDEKKKLLEAEPEQVLVLCNHCKSPSCVKVCPTGATWKRDSDGIVMMDMHRCIGCRYCMAACPYGARSFNWQEPDDESIKQDGDRPTTAYPKRTKGVVEKCTFCTEKIRAANGADVIPACVAAANAEAKAAGEDEDAMTFGKLTDPKIKTILSEQRTICRRVALGTGPNVYYIV